MSGLEEKRAVQHQANLRIGISIACWALFFLIVSQVNPEAPGAFAAVMGLMAVGGIFWIIGMMSYMKSKGYSAVLGLLTFMGPLVVLILLLLPDQWKTNVPPVVAAPTDFSQV